MLGAPDSLMGFVWLAIAGMFAGAILGACFPRAFGFIFEAFMDV